MEGLFSLLLVAGVFFLMMRVGCGSHIAHGGHQPGEHVGHGAADGGNADPVCGMQVPKDSGYTKVHQGTLYRFCSRNCLDKFEAAPLFSVLPSGCTGWEFMSFHLASQPVKLGA